MLSKRERNLFFLYYTTHSTSVLQRAIAVIGLDYASHPCWDKYIGIFLLFSVSTHVHSDFEQSHQEYTKVMEIYVRILETPLEQISKYWER